MQKSVVQSKSFGTVFIHLTTFNGEKWIDQAIQSILAQTYSDLVLNISDNASADSTKHRIEYWANEDSRIRFRIQKRNEGAYFNWMCGLEQVEHYPYFMWASQDDFWTQDWLEHCVREIETHGGVAACGQIVAVDTAGHALGNYTKRLKHHRYMRSPSRWIRLARYALDPEEFGKSGRILAVFRTSDLLEVVHKHKESVNFCIQTWDLLMVRRVLDRGEIHTFDSSTLFKRIGSTTTDFAPGVDIEVNQELRLSSRIIKFVTRIVADQQSWYRLYASDSLPLRASERALLFVKSLRLIGREFFKAIYHELRARQKAAQ